MSDTRITLGKQGEDMATAHLEKNGFQIITRNYRQKSGEIDIIAQKEPKTASEIIDKYLKGSSQNVLESIKFGYDVTTKLLEKIFKEKEDQENEGDLPSISDPEDGSSEEKEEKKDMFEELAEKRVSEQIERERKIRREQREIEKVKSENTSNIEEDVSPQTWVRCV